MVARMTWPRGRKPTSASQKRMFDFVGRMKRSEEDTFPGVDIEDWESCHPLEWGVRVYEPEESGEESERASDDGGCEMTLGEIGKELGVSRERVRQMIGKALRQLRRCMYYNRKSGEWEIKIPDDIKCRDT